jgi:hypothetical protein
LDARHTPRRVDGNRSHPRTIDHDTIVAQGSSRKVMSSTPDRERQSMRARPTNRVNNVLGIRAANERRGTFIYLPIPKLTHLIMIGTFAGDDIAREQRCKILRRGNVLHCRLPPYLAGDRHSRGCQADLPEREFLLPVPEHLALKKSNPRIRFLAPGAHILALLAAGLATICARGEFGNNAMSGWLPEMASICSQFSAHRRTVRAGRVPR